MVNPGIHAAHAAAVKARRAVLDRFRQAQASDASRAIELGELPRAQAQALERLLRDDVVRRLDDRRYYLDERQLRLQEERAKERARLVLLSIIVLVIVLLAAIGLSLLTR